LEAKKKIVRLDKYARKMLGTIENGDFKFIKDVI